MRFHRETSRNYELLYLVGVWDERDTRQRSTTITKFYQALKDYIQLDSKDFEDIGRGISLAPGIRLQLAYGVRGIIEAICDWDKSQDRTQEVLTAVEKIIYKLRNWDDLWLAYAIASMEIHVQIIHGHSNALLLVNKLRDMEVDITASQETLPSLLEDTLRKLTQKWREDTLPVRCLADQILYLRDLLLLFAYLYASLQ